MSNPLVCVRSATREIESLRQNALLLRYQTTDFPTGRRGVLAELLAHDNHVVTRLLKVQAEHLRTVALHLLEQ